MGTGARSVYELHGLRAILKRLLVIATCNVVRLKITLVECDLT